MGDRGARCFFWTSFGSVQGTGKVARDFVPLPFASHGTGFVKSVGEKKGKGCKLFNSEKG